jgi:putative flippase GtrA
MFARYVVTGGTAAVVDLGVFYALVKSGVPVVLAAALSFPAAVGVNYCASALYVFSKALTLRGFAAFFAAALYGLSINVLITYLANSYFSFPPIAAKTAGIGGAFLMNFTINYYLVFSARPSRKQQRPKDSLEIDGALRKTG